MKNLAIPLLVSLIALPVAAQETTGIEIPESYKDKNIEPKTITEIPIESLMAYEAKSGMILFMSKNGRYVLKGELTDIWAKQRLFTSEQIARSASEIPLDTMGIDFNRLGAFTYGTGHDVVHVVTDPACPSCAKLNQQIQKLGDKYTFKILVLPALGEESVQLTKKISCEPDRAKALNALFTKTAHTLKEPENCNFDPMKEAAVTADLIGVDAVPFIIAPDNRYSRGMPSDLKKWLAEGASAPIQAKAQEAISNEHVRPTQQPASNVKEQEASSLNARLLNALQ